MGYVFMFVSLSLICSLIMMCGWRILKLKLLQEIYDELAVKRKACGTALLGAPASSKSSGNYVRGKRDGLRLAMYIIESHMI